jgi:ABC-type transport system involved in multi-copper enzyme maturation permease subunit
MSAVFAIAGLTLREAIRRRFIYAGVLVSAVLLLLAVIPFHPRHSYMFSPSEMNLLIGEMIETFGGHIAEFFAFLFAIALSAGTISNEIERGVLAVILPKPIGRLSVYFGKWLGVNLFVLAFLLLWVGLLQFAVFHHIHHTMPNLWKAYFVMALYPLVFSSLTFLFSSFTSNLLSIVLPLIVASAAWTEGLLKTLGYMFDVSTLKIASKVVVYIAPLNPMSRWLEKVLDAELWQSLQRFRSSFGPVDPPAGWIDLAWIIGYGLAALIAGAIIFQRRDL